MDFGDVEKRFRELKNQLDVGTIDEERFESELRKLYVVDGEGQYWMMGAQTGQWYHYDGAKWLQASRPREEVGVPIEAPPPKPPPPSSPTQPAKAGAAPPTKRERSRLTIPLLIGLVVLCCAFGALSVVVSEFILSDKPISSFVGSLMGQTPAAPGPISTFLPSPTTNLSAAQYFRDGDQFFNDGRYEQAISQYQMAISVEPQNAEAYARLGQAYLQLGNCDQAVPEFQQALALDSDLESAQAGLMECGGALPPDVSFASYSRSDLNFSLLYPSTWFVREEDLQTIFAEKEEDVDFLRGKIFFISSLPLAPDEEGMDNMGALIKARQLINLPMGSQLGGVETVSLAGSEWATVEGEITGLQTPTTIYIAATVKDSDWYGIWAIGPADTWEQTSWPIFRTMAGTVQLEQVVAVASPTVEASPAVETPAATAEASPQPTGAPPSPSPTSQPGASPAPTTPAPTATSRPSTLSGKIAYPRYVGGQNHYELHIADISGNDINVIYAASEPALDLAGNRIAYRSWDDTYRGLVTSNVGGGNRQRPRGGAEPFEDSLPRWSPDGLALVYATKREGPHRISHVWTHVLAGHSERKLGDADNPEWSANGQQIVARTSVLIIMDSGGENRRQLTSNPTDSSPDWSPTGNKIAFMRQTGLNWDIWVINSDGTNEAKLSSAGSVDGLPAWSPDGNSIAFLSDRGGAWAIWAMNADGTNQRKLFNTGSDTYATTEEFAGEFVGREPNQRRNWLDEQISWSR